MRVEHTIAELDRLPGRSDPVRATLPRPVGRGGEPSARAAPVGGRTASGGDRVRGLHGRDQRLRLGGDGERGYHRRRVGERPATGLAGLDAESLTDTCDEHYPAWLALWVQEGRFRGLDTSRCGRRDPGALRVLDAALPPGACGPSPQRSRNEGTSVSQAGRHLITIRDRAGAVGGRRRHLNTSRPHAPRHPPRHPAHSRASPPGGRRPGCPMR